jgi:hypothetical protein
MRRQLASENPTVFDPTTLFDLFGAIAIVAVPAIVLRRFAGSEGPGLEAMFGMPFDPPWPRGVQEEEPVRWRLELLRPRSGRPEPEVDGRRSDHRRNRRVREPSLDAGGCA